MTPDTFTCDVAITLRHVVTSVEPRGAARYQHVAFPPSTLIYLDAVAMMFGVSQRRIYNLVSIHRAKLDPPHYRPRHPDPRWRRVLTEHDLTVLRTLFPVLVKR